MNGHKTRLIVNPGADLGRAWRKVADLRPLVEEYGGADWSGTVYPTHATLLARQAAEAGSSLVIAAGGDGTVHEVINGLMQVPQEARPRLGIVPLGSGNDFAHSIGIYTNPSEALKKIFTGVPNAIDVGLFDTDRGMHEYFNNTFGLGFDAIVTIRSHRLTHMRGFLMYLVAVLQTIIFDLDAPMMHITSDQEKWDDETTMLVICNGPREGGGFLVAPDSLVSDGILNYATLTRVSRLMLLRLLPEVMKGTHGRFKQVRLGQLHKMEVKAEKPFTIHADGEVIAGFGTDVRNVSVEVIPGAIELMM